MTLEFNPDEPLVMHVDLNSCFASIEQQARPMLRGRPVAIVNRRTEHTSIITASYEAKAHGVKTGMTYHEARSICPDLVALESDPPKYRYVYHKLLDIMNDYSAHVTMKSIDEGVIDFHKSTREIVGRGLQNIGLDIKQRLRDEIGVWMRCNIGISTNRFLAKTAAGLNKPDGMDVITADNYRQVLGGLSLTDLTGIAGRNQKRLNSVGIYTTEQFLDADEMVLRGMVFESVVGDWWYRRLRGWEVDDFATSIGRVGRQYVLESRTLSHSDIQKRLHNLCESIGGRLRYRGLVARGVYVYAKSRNAGYWHSSRMMSLPFFSDEAVYNIAKELFIDAPNDIREIGVHCYGLSVPESQQLHIFGDELAREAGLSRAVDSINYRFGERTIHSADTMGTDGLMSPKIPFGSTRYL